MSKIVIFGAGLIAEVAHYYFQKDSPHQIIAFTVDDSFVKESQFQGLPIIGFSQIVKDFPAADHQMFLALSYHHLNQLRAQKYVEAKEKGYTLASYVSSQAFVAEGVAPGDNAFILEHNVIQPFVRIGSNVTLWSGNHIGHHSVIGDHAFISSHVVISGQVTIGPYSFLGVNATLGNALTVAPRTVIGAGAVVLRNTVEGGVYSGHPAKLRRSLAGKLKFFR